MLPKRCTVIDNNKLDECKKCEKKRKHANDVLKRKNFNFQNHLAKRNYSLEMCFAHLISWTSGTRAIVCLWISFLFELNAQATPEQITNIGPSEHSLLQNVNHAAAEALIIILQKTKNISIFLSMNGTNRKGMHHMVKVLTF